jgi:predicted membrane protein
MARIIIGSIIIFMGLSALLGFSLFKMAFAVALVCIGISIIVGKEHEENPEEERILDEDRLSEVAVFSPFKRKIKSDKFKGGKITLVFSGGEIDLTETKTEEKEITLEVTAVFSGIKIIVPKSWKVNNKGTAILGGYDIKTGRGDDDAPTLNIKGTAFFGGVELIEKKDI